MATILVVDDDALTSRMVADLLIKEGHQVREAGGGEEGLRLAKEMNLDVVFLDVVMPGMDGIATLKRLKRLDPTLPVVMLTGHSSVESAVEAMKAGADDYLDKEHVQEKLLISAKNFLKTHALARQVNTLKADLAETRSGAIVGKSPAIRQLFTLIEKAAQTDITVLIFGESGTGKELVARAIHEKSRRADASLVAIDCAVLPDTLVESELFGYEKGAFTGAVGRKMGRFEAANSGTLFLDEIGNLPLAVQQKLLRFLEERSIERLGGKDTLKVDVRLITATNVSLEEAIKAKKFRDDLYYRLNVFSITIPPLRERRDDVPMLVEHFVERFSREQHKSKLKVSPKALEALARHEWPGNVRELRNVMERAVLLADKEVTMEHLPSSFQRVGGATFPSKDGLLGVGRKASAEAERTLLMKTLDQLRWNKTRVAKYLKIDYKTLYNKMKDYGIPQKP